MKIGRDGQEIQPKVGEELGRLFSEDKSVDLTPILRKSKEAARKHRSKGSVAKAGPLGGRHRVVSSSGGRGRGRESGRGRGGDRGRGLRRPHYDDRGQYDDRRGDRYRDRSPVDRYRDSRDYNEYLRSLAGHPSSYPPPYSSHHYLPPPSRYYDPHAAYQRSVYSSYDERSRNYDRSVDEFLRRTAEKDRDRDRRPRRY